MKRVKKIIVVEDDAAVNQLLCRKLERENYEVKGLISGRELIQSFDAGFNADLILLDYNLKDIDAAALLIKMKDKNISVPFIVCTGVGSEAIAVNMMKEGARDYLVKDKAFLDILVPTVKKTLSEIDTERELLEARHKINYQNAILAAVHELTLDGIVVINQNNKVVSFNKRFNELWPQLTLDDDMSAEKLFDIISTELINGGHFLTSVMNVGAIVSPLARKHEDLALNSGSFYELYSAPMLDPQEDSYGRVWYFRDVTLQHQARTHIENAKLQAEEAANNKAEFLANFSHEIKTPMNSLSGFLELLATSNLDKTQSDFLSSVKMSCDNLMSLINNTLDLSRLEAGALRLDGELFDISQTISEALILSDSNRIPGVELKMDITSELPPVMGDSLRLKQVLVNLLSNALKFTEKGEVLVKCQKTGVDRYLFEVIDTGQGIEPEQQQAIFAAFRQEKESTSREKGGTGLGLSISARIVRLMNGELKVESKVGEGSRFYFEINLNPLQVD